jgi:hypothetical protein
VIVHPTSVAVPARTRMSPPTMICNRHTYDIEDVLGCPNQRIGRRSILFFDEFVCVYTHTYLVCERQEHHRVPDVAVHECCHGSMNSARGGSHSRCEMRPHRSMHMQHLACYNGFDLLTVPPAINTCPPYVRAPVPCAVARTAAWIRSTQAAIFIPALANCCP